MGYSATSMGQPNTWVPVFTGFSSDPTVTARYILIGKLCFINMYPVANGTSNSTSFTVSLPFTAKDNNDFGAGTCVDNGTNTGVTVRVFLTAGSSVASLRKGFGGSTTSWTAANAKSSNLHFCYEIE